MSRSTGEMFDGMSLWSIEPKDIFIVFDWICQDIGRGSIGKKMMGRTLPPVAGEKLLTEDCTVGAQEWVLASWHLADMEHL